MASEAEAATVARGHLAAQPSGSDGGAQPPGGAPQRRSRRRRATGTPRGVRSSVEAKLDALIEMVARLADAVSPYSQFSNPMDAVYEKGSDTIVARKEKQLDESFQRPEKIPKLLEAKAGEKGHPGPDGHEGDGDGLSGPCSASGRRLALLAVQQSRGRRLRLESFRRLEKIPKLLEAKASEEGHPGPDGHEGDGDGLSEPCSASGRRLALLAVQQSRGLRLRRESFKRLEKIPRLLEAKAGEKGHPGPDGHEGDGDGLSGPYSANDADAVSPYSQFSSPEDAIYEKGGDPTVARKQKQLDEYFKRREKTPKLLETKAGEEDHPDPAALRHARGHGAPLQSDLLHTADLQGRV